MKNTKELMLHKLAAQIMKKSSISASEWDKMSDDDIMKLTQIPLKIRVNIIELRKSSLTTTELDTSIVESRVENSVTAIGEEVKATEYDPEAPVIEILAEQAIVSSEEGIAKLEYTKEELKEALSNAGSNTNWLILLKKVSSTLDKDRINTDVLTELAKEQAAINKSHKK